MANKRKALHDDAQSSNSFHTGPSCYSPSHVRVVSDNQASHCSPSRPSSVCDEVEAHQGRLARDIREADRCVSATKLFEVEEQRQRCMQSLQFRQMEARHATIRSAHSKTCEWLLDRPEYHQWRDPESFSAHHGLLWIKGKPATGKSTITKFVHASLNNTAENAVVIRFFFNARGEELERTTVGMYRALLFQLFDKIPALQTLLDSAPIASYRESSPNWDVNALEDLLSGAIGLIGQQAVFCVVDALDECEEEQVREMVRFFEHLSQLAVTSASHFHTWFSSRHYPYISIKSGIKLTLEEQEGHDRDIALYIDSEQRIERTELAVQIKNEILRRASGVFLWVVLVLQILNKEYDRGRMHALQRRLNDIPDKLEDLFDDSLMRDGPPEEEQITCLQWVLYARRPLSIPELYFAILTGHEPNLVPAWDRQLVTEHDMIRYILDCSKGLVETTRVEPKTAQFIHESVREFFLTGSGFDRPIFAPAKTFPLRSHEKLKHHCQTYYEKADVIATLALSVPLPNAFSKEAMRNYSKADETFPFLRYSAREVLYHSDTAQSLGGCQIEFLKDFRILSWIYTNNVLRPNQARQYPTDCSMLYILAEENLAALILADPLKANEVNARGGWRKDPLIAAQAAGNKEALKALLDLALTAGEPSTYQYTFCLSGQDAQEAATWLIKHKGTLEASEGQSMLLQAAAHGGDAIARILLSNRNVDVNVVDWKRRTPLFRATDRGHTDILRLLLLRDDVKYDDIQLMNAMRLAMGGNHQIPEAFSTSFATSQLATNNIEISLLVAAETGCEAFVNFQLARNDLFINRGFFHHISHGRTPLWSAANSGHARIVKSLLEKFPDDVDFADRWGTTPLCAAVQQGHLEVVRELLALSTNSINRYDASTITPLTYAARGHFTEIAEVLLSCDIVDVNLASRFGLTPLLAASNSGAMPILKLLLSRNEIDVSLKNGKGQTLLIHAAKSGHLDIVHLLLSQKEVDVNLKDHNGKIPLMYAADAGHLAVVKLLLACKK